MAAIIALFLISNSWVALHSGQRQARGSVRAKGMPARPSRNTISLSRLDLRCLISLHLGMQVDAHQMGDFVTVPPLTLIHVQRVELSTLASGPVELA